MKEIIENNQLKNNVFKCVIMAGGKGTRLWPISRKNKPKQFQCLTSDKTMLQETFLRMRQKFDIENVYVSTSEEYVREVEKEILELPGQNIIGEPQSRGSASSVALTAAVLSKENPEAIAVMLPSDHLIKNPEILIKALSEAEKFIRENEEYIVTFSIKPFLPETGFGYIKKGNSLAKTDSLEIFQVDKFVEKPDEQTAQRYLESGEYSWNSAIYVCEVKTLIEKFKRYVPDTYNHLVKIQEAVGTEKYEEVVNKEYPLMDKVDFAYSIVENDAKIAVMPLELDWSDVGSWTALKDSLSGNKNDHYIKGEHIDFNSENLLVFGNKKLITTVGVKDLIIVDTDDAILICDRNNSQLVNKAVEKLEHSGKINLL